MDIKLERSCIVKIIVVFLILIGLGVVGLISGAIGNALFGGGGFFGFFTVPKPHPKLPAETVLHIGNFSITNTLFASWLTMIVLVCFALAVTRRMKVIPGRVQNFFELIIESLLNFVESVAGKENGRKFFPVIATIFLFVIANAWLSLLPGFGSIVVHGVEEETHLLRGANTDINVPLAVAVASFIFVEYWGVVSLGFFTYMSKFFNVRGIFYGIAQIFKGKIKVGITSIFTGVINAFIGVLESISELVRMVSFTFRLFGNMLAGEILLLTAAFLVPWVVPVVFYGLELLVGFVQALIFSGLTLVFVTVAVAHTHNEDK